MTKSEALVISGFHVRILKGFNVFAQGGVKQRSEP